MRQPARKPRHRPFIRLQRLAVPCLALLSLAGYCAPVSAACIGSAGEVTVSACRGELASNPRNLEVRLALTSALHRAGDKDEALKVLDEGLAIFRGDEASRSVLEEKRWMIQKQKDRGAADDVAVKAKVITCTKLKGATALKACEEGLAIRPDNPQLLAGKGDALLGLAPPRVIDAIQSYRKALAIVPADAALQQRLARAESARQKIVAECMDGQGRSALDACDRGLLKGATDEAAIQARRGDLLAAMNKDSAALNAYRTALRLDPRNAGVKQAIAALTVAASAAPAPAPRPESAAAPAPAPQPEPAPVRQPGPAAATPTPPRPADSPSLSGARRFSNAPLAQGGTY